MKDIQAGLNSPLGDLLAEGQLRNTKDIIYAGKKGQRGLITCIQYFNTSATNQTCKTYFKRLVSRQWHQIVLDSLGPAVIKDMTSLMYFKGEDVIEAEATDDMVVNYFIWGFVKSINWGQGEAA